MSVTICGIKVCSVSGSQWRRDWENPCCNCECKESCECPGGIIEDDDEDGTES